jgi:hypothetical protein
MDPVGILARIFTFCGGTQLGNVVIRNRRGKTSIASLIMTGRRQIDCTSGLATYKNE